MTPQELENQIKELSVAAYELGRKSREHADLLIPNHPDKYSHQALTLVYNKVGLGLSLLGQIINLTSTTANKVDNPQKLAEFERGLDS